jgi:hypothetical protein
LTPGKRPELDARSEHQQDQAELVEGVERIGDDSGLREHSGARLGK